MTLHHGTPVAAADVPVMQTMLVDRMRTRTETKRRMRRTRRRRAKRRTSVPGRCPTARRAAGVWDRCLAAVVADTCP
jgi:hypothetical protein